MKAYPILVGADGTDHSKAAVRWAAREAQCRHLPLRVTYGYDWDFRDPRYGPSFDDPDSIHKHAEGIAETAAYEARAVAAHLDVEADPVIGPRPRSFWPGPPRRS